MAGWIRSLNLVLLGKIGTGKSASGNTILGQEAFLTSVTQDLAIKSKTFCGRRVTVYDTPGLFNTKLSEEKVLQIYENVLQRCESGRCVFLLVIEADRFIKIDGETVEKIEKLLGEKRLEKTLILFTRGDELEEEKKTIDEFINGSKALRKLVQKYDQRYHVFNNKKGPNGQVPELLSKIDAIEKGAKPKGLSIEWEQQIPQMIQMFFGSLTRWIPVRVHAPDKSDISRRIVLLGKTGAGKSAAGNTILGQEVFEYGYGPYTVTSKCSEAHVTVSDRSVSVVDTPGFIHTEMNTEQLVTEIARSVYLSSPGPHAFIIVFRVYDRFTKHEELILQMIEIMFGLEVLKYSIILFTHGDWLEDETVEEDGQCEGRFHIFNNKDQNNREQVNYLLQKIDTMIEQNGGGHYSTEMFEEVQRLRKEEEEKRQRENKVRKQLENKQRLEKGERETRQRRRAEQNMN